MHILDHQQKHRETLRFSSLSDITNAIHNHLQQKEKTSPFILALDGRCTAGKTTLAQLLAPHWSCNVVHTDDFYLPFSQRTAPRLELPGGHMDIERLRDEILRPIQAGESAICRPYACHEDKWLEAYHLDPSKPTIVEGSYSCHPIIAELYDCKVFIDISSALQRARLIKRSPETLYAFLTKWIPREESYFQIYDIREACDLVVEAVN